MSNTTDLEEIFLSVSKQHSLLASTIHLTSKTSLSLWEKLFNPHPTSRKANLTPSAAANIMNQLLQEACAALPSSSSSSTTSSSSANNVNNINFDDAHAIINNTDRLAILFGYTVASDFARNPLEGKKKAHHLLQLMHSSIPIRHAIAVHIYGKKITTSFFDRINIFAPAIDTLYMTKVREVVVFPPHPQHNCLGSSSCGNGRHPPGGLHLRPQQQQQQQQHYRDSSCWWLVLEFCPDWSTRFPCGQVGRLCRHSKYQFTFQPFATLCML